MHLPLPQAQKHDIKKGFGLIKKVEEEIKRLFDIELVGRNDAA